MVTVTFNGSVTWMARRPTGVQNPQILDSFPQHSNSAGFGRLILVILYPIRIAMGTPEPVPDGRPGIGRIGVLLLRFRCLDMH